MTTTLGLVGLGEIHRWHAEALRSVPGLSARVAYDLDPGREPRLDGVRRVGSLDELLDARPDLVLVAVPTPDHEEVGRPILEAGTDVVLEKPATLMPEALDRLYDAADRHDARLLVAFHDAFGVELSYFRTHLFERLRADHGPLRRIRCLFRDPYVARGAPKARLRSLYGSWHDSGVNALSVVCRLVGVAGAPDGRPRTAPRFEEVSCRMEPLEGFGDRRTVAAYRAGDVELTVETDWTRDERRKETRLDFAGAEAVLDHAARTVTLETSAGSEELFAVRSVLPRLTEQYVGVFRHLRNPARVDAGNRSFSREVHRLLFEAAASGAP